MASLKKNLIANFIGRSWSAVLGLLLIPVYIKLMGVESYGLVGFYLTLSSVFGILDLGIGATMSRELAKRSVDIQTNGSAKDLVRTLELIYWGIAFAAGTLVILLAPVIANHWIKSTLPTDLILHTVQIMGVAFAFQFPVSLYQGGLMGLQKQVLTNILLVITGTIKGLGAVAVLYFFSPSIQTYFTWQLIASATTSVSFFIAIWANIPGSKKKANFRTAILSDIWKYAATLSANALIGIVLTQLDKVILTTLLPLKQFTYYSLAATAASVIWMIILPFSNAVFPNLVQMCELKQQDALKTFFHKSSQVLSFILLPVSAVLVIFSKTILLLWLHDPVIADNASLILKFLVLGTMFNGIALLPCDTAMAFGFPQLITYTNIIQSILLIPLIVLLVNWLNGVGAGMAWLALNSTYIIFMIPVFFRKYLQQEKLKWYLQDVGLPLVTAFITCKLLSLFFIDTNNSIVTIIELAGAGVITMVTTALVLPNIRTIAFSTISKIKHT